MWGLGGLCLGLKGFECKSAGLDFRVLASSSLVRALG